MPERVDLDRKPQLGCPNRKTIVLGGKEFPSRCRRPAGHVEYCFFQTDKAAANTISAYDLYYADDDKSEGTFMIGEGPQTSPSIDARLKAVEEEAFRLRDELAKWQWISVKDRLPEPGVAVLVIAVRELGSSCHYTAYRLDSDGSWIWRDSHFGGQLGKFTHWMPLPEPPKKEIL